MIGNDNDEGCLRRKIKMKKKIKMSMKRGVAAVYKECHVGLAILYKVAYSHVNRLTARHRECELKDTR